MPPPNRAPVAIAPMTSTQAAISSWPVKGQNCNVTCCVLETANTIARLMAAIVRINQRKRPMKFIARPVSG